MKIETRTDGIELTYELRNHIERRLRLALTRFDRRIRRVHVRLEDVNGPRGGKDTYCKLRVELTPRDEVVIEGLYEDPFTAMAVTSDRLSYAVSRRLERMNVRRRSRALRPIRGRLSGSMAPGRRGLGLSA